MGTDGWHCWASLNFVFIMLPTPQYLRKCLSTPIYLLIVGFSVFFTTTSKPLFTDTKNTQFYKIPAKYKSLSCVELINICKVYIAPFCKMVKIEQTQKCNYPNTSKNTKVFIFSLQLSEFVKDPQNNTFSESI
ncbi:hypothetical protein AB205_0160980 [Aquarana catesbeiana]|uniref:Uncharacterized protein n=1 Tax=Aquarana catesbeiana TaxID=8400 RepID=A0A2G9S6F8_AQUCT|nr:hypothetical protein AB205_0160980 [Aquarana catesbeiana]